MRNPQETHPWLMGTGVALITPFTENGEINFNALTQLLDHCREGGVDYYVVLGTTGEPATLTKEEKKKVFEFVYEYNAGRVPLVAGIGGNNTHEILENFKEFPLKGYSAILSVSPYYNKPSQEGIYQHYKALSQAAPLPLLLYNVPGRTGSNISPATTLRLAQEFSNILGTKEASGSFEQFSEILAGKPDSFLLISGDDAIAVPMISIGAKGLISVLANSHPKECSQMVKNALAGNFDLARKNHLDISPWVPILFKESNPTGVKAILKKLGLLDSSVRLPLVSASENLYKEIDTLLTK